MGIFSLPTTIAYHIITYLYPLYASYKAITGHTPSNSSSGVHRSFTGQERTELAELESWLMYWSIVGAMTLVEGWAEWAWSWLPFYGIVKVVFTFWLVLPQTQGATILYTRYLGPFIRAHEDDIDVALNSAKRQAGQAAGDWITILWRRLRRTILGAAMAAEDDQASEKPSHPTQAPTREEKAPPRSSHDPASGSLDQVFGLLKQFGPSAAAGLVGAMDKVAEAAAAAGAPPRGAETTTASAKSASGVAGATTSATRRRSELEKTLLSEPDVRRGPKSRPQSSGAKSDLSSGDDSVTPPKDLSGSYQLVDDDDYGDQTAPVASETASGWGAWLGRSG